MDEGGGEAGRSRSVSTLAAVYRSSPRAGSKEGRKGKRRGRSRVEEGGAGETLLGSGTFALVARRFRHSYHPVGCAFA